MAQTRKLTKARKFLFSLTFLSIIEFVFPFNAVASSGAPLNASPEPKVLESYNSIMQSIRVLSGVPNPKERLPEIGLIPVKKVMTATVTAYSSSVDECDSDPFTTASGSRTHMGTMAYNYLPFGTKIRIPQIYGDRVFVIEDRLRAGASHYHFDIWQPSKAEAKQWGVKYLRIEIL